MTGCWQSSKECGLLLGALARHLPLEGGCPAEGRSQLAWLCHCRRRVDWLVTASLARSASCRLWCVHTHGLPCGQRMLAGVPLPQAAIAGSTV